MSHHPTPLQHALDAREALRQAFPSLSEEALRWYALGVEAGFTQGQRAVVSAPFCRNFARDPYDEQP